MTLRNTGKADGDIGATFFDMAGRTWSIEKVIGKDDVEIGPEGYAH